MASFIKNMLGGSDESTEQLIAALNERLEQLEKKNNEIEKALNEQNLKIERLLSTLEAKKLKDNNAMGSTISASIESSSSVGSEGEVKDEASAKSEARDVVEESKSEEPTTLYFSAPTPSGEFCAPSTKEQPGSSIYRLVTKDNVNGRFTMLNTPDAVATANISVSQFVKPVCKILSTTSSIPRHIITREEGTATMTDGGTWKVTKKAQIEFVG